MADVVQFRLERMVDELDDLERRGLFSRREISEIVKKRRDFEYRLKRPSPLKQDYLSYIDYEVHLDSLRNLRKKSVIGELRKLGDGGAKEEEGEKRSKKNRKRKVWKKSISDVAGVMRILEIFRMASLRYKGDLGLWFRYLEFCRERRHGRMKQVLAQALRFHPKVPGLWIYAAAWEFDQNLNITAARALMQSGLRVCLKSEDLWIEYLRMELTYLNKLKARKIALGEDVRTLSQGDGKSDESKQWKEGNKDLFMSLNGDQEDVEGAMDERENFFWNHGSSILQTIYHGAVEALPSSMSLRKRFLEILDNVDLAHSDELKLEVMEDIKCSFSREEDFWDWLAKLQIRDADFWKDLPKVEVICKLNKAIQVYEEALSILPSTKMFSLYANFWLDIISPEGEITNSLLGNHEVNSVEFVSDIIKIYEKAETSGCLTDDLAHQYISFYLQMGRLEEARKLAERLCNGKHLQAANLRALWVSIEMKWLTSKSASLSMDDVNHIFKLLIQVLPILSVSEAEILWLLAIKTFSNKKDQFDKLVQSFIITLARSGGGDNVSSVSSAIVNCILQRDGIQRARDTYKRLLALPHPNLALFRHCIELETNLALIGESDALVNTRKLYESALNIYNQNGRLWKDYYSLEMKVGTSETVNAIYWRARKTLGDTIELSAPSDL